MVFIPQLAGVSGLATEKVAIGGEPEPAPGAPGEKWDKRGEPMKALMWIAAGVCVVAMAWTLGPDLRRYVRISTM
jgi:hypothetical protein